jgi:hypothetical protein
VVLAGPIALDAGDADRVRADSRSSVSCVPERYSDPVGHAIGHLVSDAPYRRRGFGWTQLRHTAPARPRNFLRDQLRTTDQNH